VLPLLAIVIATNQESDWWPLVKESLLFLALLLFWAYAILVRPYTNTRKQFREQALLQEPVTYTFRTENFAATRRSASSVVDWHVLKHIR